ncbi:MAG TPA: polysaccharide biosynthesis tyrosine autokinase [Thermodesulfovibrionales bacterium]|nr:polysaccharide biosynthesis tyrosine autokinase [Thermodesulfovibrionales bacterium]
MQNTPRQPFDSDDIIHLQDYLNVLLRRRRAFLVTFTAIFLGVMAYTFLMKPVYEASATLRVKEEKGKLSTLEEITLGTTSPVNAEIEILKSRTNAEKVVKRLNLHLATEKIKGDPSFRILELTPGPKTTAYTIELNGTDTYTVRDDSGSTLGSGKSGVLLQTKDLTLLIDKLRGAVEDQIRIDILPFYKVVKDLRETTNAEENPRQTNIIKLSYTSTNAELAKDVANGLVQAFLEQTIAFKAEEASRTLDFLDQQLENIKKDLDVAERNLEAFKRTTGVVLLDAESQELIRKYSETEKTRAEAMLQKKQIEFALTSLKDAMTRQQTYSPSVFRDDPLISGMAAKAAELEVQKQSLLAEYTTAHPTVRTLQEQIDQIQRNIQVTYETGLKNSDRMESNITGQLAIYEAQLKRLPSRERELARLIRVFKVNADIYTFLLQKREETRIARASTISNIDIVDPAITPDEPVRPKKLLYIFLGLVAGTMISVFAAFFMEYLDDTIKDAETAKRELQVPLLTVIPFIPTKEGDVEKEKHITLITHYEPKSTVTEAFRSLRTSIHFSGVNKKRQVLLVTSSLPYEGKTTIMGNLAVILGQAAGRVLLLDCDLRRPSLHKLFGHDKVPGLTEILAGENNIYSYAHNTGIAGLDFISAGTTPPNPAELLGSEKMKALLQDFRSRYDTILLDAPPVLAVTDALLLSTMTDMVFMVLELGRVPIKAAVHGRELLQNVGAPIAGFVLNDKSERRLERYGYYGEKYYRYGYYGYAYSHYGEETPKNEKKQKRQWWKRFITRK